MTQLERNFMAVTDAWRLYRKYHGIKNGEDARWREMIDEAVRIQTRHGYSPLIQRAVMMFMELLEDEAKEIDK